VAARQPDHPWLTDSQPLVISSYTLGTEVPFEQRARVAAEAGFAGIGLRAENYWDALAAGLDDAAMKAILDRHGVSVMEVEYLTAWGTEQDRDSAQREKERTIYHMARTFGVGHVNAGILEKLPVEVLIDAFGNLCRRAGELVVGLEFMPYSGVPDISTAWAVVSDAGQPNGALLMDGWHWSRAGMTPADLEPVPAEKIVSIQLCDVAEEPMEAMRAESLGHWRPRRSFRKWSRWRSSRTIWSGAGWTSPLPQASRPPETCWPRRGKRHDLHGAGARRRL
jgi:sugar phosphate isomerase/epimerase